MPRSAELLSHESIDNHWPILVCLFGAFRLLKRGRPVAVRGGGQMETFLSTLALSHAKGVPRATLLEVVWPDTDPPLAAQSLNSLVHRLYYDLGDALGGARLILHTDGYYRLNAEAGVGVDITCFEALAKAGDALARNDGKAAASVLYRRAVDLYAGDLCVGADGSGLIERERLRARHLTLLASLAMYSYDQGDYRAALDQALVLLGSDACREDAHRIVMRCYVHLGERAQALRQFRLCEELLHTEFAATPEAATRVLFNQVRSDPGGDYLFRQTSADSE